MFPTKALRIDATPFAMQPLRHAEVRQDHLPSLCAANTQRSPFIAFLRMLPFFWATNSVLLARLPLSESRLHVCVPTRTLCHRLFP